jgi:hypothetical protein
MSRLRTFIRGALDSAGAPAARGAATSDTGRAAAVDGGAGREPGT